MATQQQKSDHVTRVRQETTNLANAIGRLRILKMKYDAQGLEIDLQDIDIIGENFGISAQDIKDAYVAIALIEKALSSGGEEALLKVVMS